MKKCELINGGHTFGLLPVKYSHQLKVSWKDTRSYECPYFGYLYVMLPNGKFPFKALHFLCVVCTVVMLDLYRTLTLYRILPTSLLVIAVSG